jgi:hypothetical protein
MPKIADPIQFTADLDQFIGTQEWHRFNALFPNVLLTDGAKYIAEECGAYWLMDLIASWQVYARVREHQFQTWTLTVDGRQAVAVADDGNDTLIASQKIEYTDFPLPTIKLFAVYGDGILVIMLPSEN